MADFIARRKISVGLVLIALCFPAIQMVRAWSLRVSDETLQAGRELFEHKWSAGDSLSASGDGLGPVFNAHSCLECHFQGGVGGGGPNEKNVLAYEALPTKANPQVKSGVVHASAVNRALQETQDDIRKMFPIIKGGIRLVDGCSTQTLDFDPVRYTSVNTPPLFGLALLEQEVSDWQLLRDGASRRLDRLSRELGTDFSGTTIGRLRALPGNRVGRFGWKGQFATVEDFVAAACAVELGLSNPKRRQDLARQHVPDPNAGLDLNKQQLRALVAFVEHLPRPVQVTPTDPRLAKFAKQGEELFATIGCADCHTPNLGSVEGVYSDLRLYEIERTQDPVYNNGSPEVELPPSEPKPAEWKTPPLWGVADSAPYFHDGASPTLESAILRHDADASAAKKKFQGLPVPDRGAVVAFLRTLRAPPFAVPPTDELAAGR